MSAATPKPHSDHRQECLTGGGGTEEGKAVVVNSENTSNPTLVLKIMAEDIRVMKLGPRSPRTDKNFTKPRTY